MTNIQQQYYTHTVVLQNLLNRITPTRGKEKVYALRGAITLEERNAIVVALNELKIRLHSLTLSGDGEKKGTSHEQSAK